MGDSMTTLSMDLSPDLDETHAPAFWYRAAPVEAFPENAGACVQVGDRQIAVFHFARRGEWYACQNLCPHRGEMSLSRGLLGSAGEVPKVACPFHKKTFSLETGECLNGDVGTISTYPIRIEDGHVLIGIPLEPGSRDTRPRPTDSSSSPR
jgi:nitrite reductase (NADH) small subunit